MDRLNDFGNVSLVFLFLAQVMVLAPSARYDNGQGSELEAIPPRSFRKTLLLKLSLLSLGSMSFQFR